MKTTPQPEDEFLEALRAEWGFELVDRCAKRRTRAVPKIPNYKLLQKIGQGSFGVVWSARDELGRKCAVKILANNIDYELEALKRAAVGSFPFLVKIYHLGRTRNRVYYAMELVDETLESRMKREGRFGTEEALSTIEALISALMDCHTKGLAHRDVKPSNIGFDASKQLRLLDLGVVTEATRRQRTIVGTRGYMPVHPGETAAHDDLYATGVILHQLITGEMPGAGEEAKSNETPLQEILLVAKRAIAPDPQARFGSAADFLQEIQRFRVRNFEMSRIGKGEPEGSNKSKPKETDEILMKSEHQHLAEAAEIVGSVGLIQQRKNLLEECRRLGEPRYRVSVVGQFKTGKSTLINKVFLKQDILFRDVQAATAVPTDIQRGKSPRLLVYASPKDPFNSEVGPEVIANPSTEIIRERTAGDDRATRTELARKTGRVVLEWPCEALSDYIITDTPGINETNEAVVSTTYRVIPESDATIYLVKAATLDEVDKRFLASKVFEKGVSRCLVVVNHDAATSAARNDEQLGAIVEEIGAQLASMGRELPITVIRLFESASDDASLPAVTPLSDVESIIQKFIAKNVVPGRLERAQTVFKREIRSALAQCEMELAALNKSDSEKHQIRERLQAEAAEFEKRSRALFVGFLDDLRGLQNSVFRRISDGLDKIFADFSNGFNRCEELGDVQLRLRDASNVLLPRIEELCFRVSTESQKEAAALQQRYQSAMQQAIDPWLKSTIDQLAIEGGFFAEISPTLVLIGDFVLTAFVLPGGWLIDAILRLLLGTVGPIKKVLPTEIAKQYLIKRVKESLMENLTAIKGSIRGQMDQHYCNGQVELDKEWRANEERQKELLLGPLERSLNETKDPKRAAVLKDAMEALAKFNAA